ncbi:magnesium transporter MgtE N-terminal domain-containing protein [Halobacillus sp. BBL2006]|uniref:magnesium transporter MgtE N-terminal domain-containing protein n=1 Tax=Halobacillus sp. BBL2006 TaxID=1543706 RepID=UPI000541FA43|nr:hypothetical protein [Halobacillus sp. BBL2006]KHE73295.1 hypothetical protein LD39_00045 [Halobacillus sp. BBL2006]
MAKKAKVKQEKGSKLQWFFFGIVIPTVFAATLALIVFTLLGINVFEQAEKYANQVPGLSKIVSTSVEKEEVVKEEQLQATIANGEAQIEQLQSEVESKQAVIQDMEQQIVQLEADLKASNESKTENKQDASENLAISFEEMDPEEAAPIVEEMDKALAVKMLAQVPDEERGEILGKMDPEIAAGIASSLMQED